MKIFVKILRIRIYRARLLANSHLKMTWPPQEDKESTGCSQYPSLSGPPIYRRESLGSEDNWNPAQTPDSYTGKFWSPSASRNLFRKSKNCLETPSMPNSPDLKPVLPMSGRKTPESREPSLNLETSPSREPTPRTGNESGSMLNEVNLCEFLPIFVLTVTGLSEQSALIMRNQLEWSELATYSGVQLGLGSQNLLGSKPEWKLIVRIQTPSSGAVTVANHMLSSMNFVVESMSRTYSDGLIVTRATWKSKDQVCRYVQQPFGLQPTWSLNDGTQTWIPRPMTP